MGVTDNLFKSIVAGKKGGNLGIPTNLPTIDEYTYGVQRKQLVTVFADSGAGKTTYVLQNYVYQAVKWALETKREVNILYFSFEMSSEALFAKLLPLYIWENYGVVISFAEILSLGGILSDEKYEMICDAKAWLETIEPMFTIIDKPMTSDQIGVMIRAWNEKFGRFIDLEDDQEEYIPKNKDAFKIVIIDHIKLTKAGPRGSKVAIDEVAEEFIYYRNKCDITGVMIQQANRQSKSMDRRNGGFQMLQTDDMSDSSGPAQASELIIGIFHPHREKVTRIEEYNIKALGDRARVVQLLKGRYGVSDVNKCVAFYGELGLFQELPDADKIYDYADIVNIGEQKPADKKQEDKVIEEFVPNFSF